MSATSLCPTLHPGDVVILDNLAPHKSQPTLLIEAAGAAIRFLSQPITGPQPNEKLWSKVKASLRTAEARTQPTLVQAMAVALEGMTQDARNWFASCGYSFI